MLLASGEVLEVGFGGGLNLPFYDKQKVHKISGLEPSEGMRHKTRPMVEASGLNVEFIDLQGENIPLGTNSVDTVLVTYYSCTIPDVVAALDNMRQVLRPGECLLYCEHGIAPDGSVRRWQRRRNPLWSWAAGGCNLDRDIPDLLKKGGFEMTVDDRMYIPGLKILCYNYWGVAKAARSPRVHLLQIRPTSVLNPIGIRFHAREQSLANQVP